MGGCVAGNGPDVIILGTGNYSLSITGTDEDASYTGDLDITDDLEIRGSGAATTIVSANGVDRVFHIDPAEVGLQVEIRDVVEANTALRGGGVRVTIFGDLEIFDSIIQGNTADDEGGGVYGDAPIALDNVQLVDNEAHRGGGIFCDSACDLFDVSISENLANSGGGLYNDNVSELMNVVINNNHADNDGGGIFSEADLSLVNVTISDNFAESDGSGLFSESTAHLFAGRARH